MVYERGCTVKILLRACFLLLTALCAVNSVNAQGCRPFSINFSISTDIYDNSTNTSQPTVVYVNVTYSGSASMPGGNCGNPTHTPSAYNVVNGVGGWVNGAGG